MLDRGHYSTEQRNPKSMGLGNMSVAQAFDLINGEDAIIAAAVAAARDDICRAHEQSLGKRERMPFHRYW